VVEQDCVAAAVVALPRDALELLGEREQALGQRGAVVVDRDSFPSW
jgi:hypothetical protein